MKAKALHPWQVTTHEAIAIQKRLRQQVITENTLAEVRYIAGADIATSKDSPKAYAGVVVLSYPALDVVEERGLEDEVTFPYVPGLLAFREGPALIKVFEQLSTEPDVIVFDGQGLAHPRGMGIATHMGLVFDKPSIGCAKSLLFGRYQEPDQEKGAWAELRDPQGRIIGAVLRTKPKTTPIFVSIGHRLDLPAAIRILIEGTRGVRIPEPTRLAHNFVTQLRHGGGRSGGQLRML
ncbi:MAG TPA: deoxyribonuclease V [Candidatus Tectomicrobia bacterium]|nr:deoxyribonuclease V [Candidatus Tectomicrobia bacterium]